MAGFAFPDAFKDVGHVLVVDDSEVVRTRVSALFESHGLVVANACDGIDGLRQALADPPALLVLDMEMPGLDGPKVLAALRAARVDCPVVLLTGSMRASRIAEAVRISKLEYLCKPYQERDLAMAAERAMGRPLPDSTFEVPVLSIDPTGRVAEWVKRNAPRYMRVKSARSVSEALRVLEQNEWLFLCIDGPQEVSEPLRELAPELPVIGFDRLSASTWVDVHNSFMRSPVRAASGGVVVQPYRGLPEFEPQWTARLLASVAEHMDQECRGLGAEFTVTASKMTAEAETSVRALAQVRAVELRWTKAGVAPESARKSDPSAA